MSGIPIMPAKQLHAYRVRVVKELAELQKASHEASIEARDKQFELDAIARAKKLLNIEIEVSDHAVLRYIERKLGIDIEAIRAEIASPTTIAAIKAGALSVVSEGFRYVIRGNRIVSVLDKDMRVTT